MTQITLTAWSFSFLGQKTDIYDKHIDFPACIIYFIEQKIHFIIEWMKKEEIS
jgi:hypothetical protein